MYELWAWNNQWGWSIVGQYHTLKQARIIRDDYQQRGIKAQIRHDESVVVH